MESLRGWEKNLRPSSMGTYPSPAARPLLFEFGEGPENPASTGRIGLWTRLRRGARRPRTRGWKEGQALPEGVGRGVPIGAPGSDDPRPQCSGERLRQARAHHWNPADGGGASQGRRAGWAERQPSLTVGGTHLGPAPPPSFKPSERAWSLHRATQSRGPASPTLREVPTTHRPLGRDPPFRRRRGLLPPQEKVSTNNS